ncbi:MAG: P-II family nitrogen regulator [Helicobacteraceae bacterium]|nr:P-II family nitrogen regulator [Helicobacteraceae bacterium]
MKEVMAIVRMNMMNKTKNALLKAGISSLNANECLGRGKGLVNLPVLNGAEKRYEEMMNELGNAGRLVPKRILRVVVPNKLVKTVVDAIISVNKTGRSGDGKIFVLPIAEAWQVRTSLSGEEILDQ